MTKIVHMLVALHARLNPREQRLVGIFGALLTATAIWALVLQPLSGLREGIRKDVVSLTQELTVLRDLGSRVKLLEASGTKAVRMKPDPDFSLLAFMDRIASKSVSPESVEAMSPARRRIDATSEESSVELRLASITLAEAVDLLGAVQATANPVFIKQFELRKRYDDDSRFDVTMVAAAIVQS
ncbi:MAG: type II secretory pathway component PulM [Hyphomicrobiaceae bacterium]|jgi:type II secretory pathway component PulM